MTAAVTYRYLRYSALAYLLFVIYGSLVPLDYHPRPLAEAWDILLDIPYLDLGIQSRADWVANILLMIPLSLLALAGTRHGGSFVRKLTLSATVVLACTALAVSIEFAQIFFPPRTVSRNDIIAESLGALAGATLWWGAGGRLHSTLARWINTHAPQNRTEQFYYTFLLLLIGYNLLPLDLTLSPAEIYHKWREGRVVLIPFSHGHAGAAEAVYGVGSDVLIWGVLGWLARLTRNASSLRLLLGLAAIAALIEFLQLFVYSRVSDITQIITATAGGAIGLGLATRWRAGASLAHASGAARIGHSAMWGALALLWLGILALVFWYPFDFRFDGNFVRERLDTLHRVPFEAYYYGSEYRAATEFLHKTGFFLPLGALLMLAAATPALRIPRVALQAAIVLLLAICAFGIELGQLFLPGKIADATDWLLATLGGTAGMLSAAQWLAPAGQGGTPQPQPRPAPTSGLPPLAHLLSGVAAMTLLGWLALHSPNVPYNLRELLRRESPLLSMALLSISIYWCSAFPVWSATWVRESARRAFAYPLIVLAHAALAWALLRLAAPVESMHDVVGSPVLNWPWEWETLGRFVALFGVLSLLFHGAALFVAALCRQARLRHFGYWLCAVLLLAPLMHLVVVNHAATDNLTELMAQGGSFLSSLTLGGYLFTLALAASLLAAQAARACRRLRLIGALWLALSLPLGYLALTLGTEGTIIKYNQVFSAMQFLFSADREHYATGLALVMRYGMFQLAATLTLALAQYPLWLWLFNAAPAAPERKRRHSSRAAAGPDSAPANEAGPAAATVRKSGRQSR